MTVDFLALTDAVQSHALSSGWFDSVNGFEPKSAPGNGLTAAVWLQDISPVPSGSGLATTAARVELNVRIYTSMLSEPMDAIDPNMASAASDLMSRYSGNFTLGGLVRNVDLLGQAGEAMRGRAGYLTINNLMYRVFTITLPLIVSDVWEQAA